MSKIRCVGCGKEMDLTEKRNNRIEDYECEDCNSYAEIHYDNEHNMTDYIWGNKEF